MSDRHKTAIANRDKQALKELAIEYDTINCPRIASAIRTEARAIRAVKIHDMKGNEDARE